MATLRLTTGGELLEALAADHAVIRLKVTDAIRNRPDLINDYGSEVAQAIADALWERLRLETEPAVKSSVLGALAALDDDWVIPKCTRVLQTPDHKLALEAATVLDGRDLSQQPAALRIRTWVLAQNCEAIDASLADDYIPAWLEELNGPYSSVAHEMLSSFGTRIVTLLAKRHRELNAVSLAWLVSISGESEVSARSTLLQHAIDSSDVRVVCAALAVSRERYDELPSSLQQRALDCVDHADPEVRRQSLLLPREHSQLIQCFDRETDNLVRVALLRQFSPTDPSGRQRLDDALSGGNWRERAAAIDAFAAAGPAILDDVRTVYLSSVGIEQAAACQVLLRLGEEDWIRTAIQR